MNSNTTANEIFDQLKTISSPPTEDVFKKVEGHQDLLTPYLLSELSDFSNNPKIISTYDSGYIRHVVSLFLLAYFKEKAAYPLIIKLISHPGDEVIKLTGEVFTEALGRILASVFDGDMEPIKSVVENPDVSPWLRSGALDSLMVLWKEGALSREDIVSYLKELMDGKLEAKPSYVWDSIALIAYDLHPYELEKPLRKAIKKKLIEPIVLNEQSLDACLKVNLIDVLKSKKNVVDGYIKSPIQELTWWLYPDEKALDKGMDYAALSVPIVDKKVAPGERGAPIGWRPDTVTRTSKKIGRNDSCYCGSGKKYKKCCGAN
ncbi:MAG TPA: DUF1186 domain-containing protein [Cycloclasticus sp.]|jgi:hypothetical protein|nr:DUF1186 domain-containing protein [Cycloclasticus sp.]